VRPFSASAGVRCKGYSLGLQRVITDFGADHAFGKVPARVKEHYGIEVPESSVRAITEKHAQAMEREGERATQLGPGGVTELLGELDGSFLPVVSIAQRQQEEEPTDRRKRRQVGWKEVRLSLVRDPNQVTPRYAATAEGPEEAGNQFVDLLVRAGGGQRTKLHCVGDGAPWIAGLIHTRFDKQATYLIDFYHLSEYLAGASEAVGDKKKHVWRTAQQKRMKENQIGEVLKELTRLESKSTGDRLEKVQACKRYMLNRLDQFDYKSALAADLPIGSGEVESGHRSVLHPRIKRPGAWWKIENLRKMVALCITRANGEWNNYWEDCRQAAA
jgi:Uncharacterised protein family (UPF0236)